MTLLILYNDLYSEGFISWLVTRLKIELLYKIKKNKIIPLSNYINSFDNPFKNILNKNNISFYDLIVYGINNLIYIKTKKGYIITINPYKYLPYCKIPIKSFCKLLNNGVFGISGYPLLSNHFNMVKDNLTEYYKDYEKQFYIG